MCNFLSCWVTVKESTKLLALGTQRKHGHVLKDGVKGTEVLTSVDTTAFISKKQFSGE